MIPCGERCQYQNDGCCMLNRPMPVTGCGTEKKCVYFVPIESTDKKTTIAKNSDQRTSAS